MTIPHTIEFNIKSRVLADLAPSNAFVFSRAAASSLLGGSLSLFFCGQFGIELGAWSFDFSQHLPMGMSPLACAIMCGLIFSVLPVLMMRFLFFNAIQFRAVVRRYFALMLAPFYIWLPILAFQGDFSNMFLELFWWSVSASAGAMFLAWLVQLGLFNTLTFRAEP